MRFIAPSQLFKKTLKSSPKIYYITTYDNYNIRNQFSTYCKMKSEVIKTVKDYRKRILFFKIHKI